MTPELWAALFACLGGIGTALKWSVGRWEAGEAANRASTQSMTNALIANTASNAVLIVKMDELVRSNAELGHKVDSIGDFVQEHTPVQARTRTPARGVRLPSRGGHHDGED